MRTLKMKSLVLTSILTLNVSAALAYTAPVICNEAKDAFASAQPFQESIMPKILDKTWSAFYQVGCGTNPNKVVTNFDCEGIKLNLMSKDVEEILNGCLVPDRMYGIALGDMNHIRMTKSRNIESHNPFTGAKTVVTGIKTELFQFDGTYMSETITPIQKAGAFALDILLNKGGECRYIASSDRIICVDNASTMDQVTVFKVSPFKI